MRTTLSRFRAVAIVALGLLVALMAVDAGMVVLASGIDVIAGAAAAVVTEVTHTGFRATALATVTLANNMLGLAPGPVLVGALSDAYGLQAAMTIAPLASLAAAACFMLGAPYYDHDRAKFEELAAKNGMAPVFAATDLLVDTITESRGD